MLRLIQLLGRLPGVGRRSAERMAIRLARDPGTLKQDLVAALERVTAEITACGRCGNLTARSADPCRLCTDPARDRQLLCVVEDPGDIVRIEQAGGYRGLYHALMGKLSPMRGEGPAQIRLQALVRRIPEEQIREVVLALNADVESDATAAFLRETLADTPVHLSRLALGLPAGSGLAFSDPITIARAIQGRTDFNP
jgi:recombination protein RecR